MLIGIGGGMEMVTEAGGGRTEIDPGQIEVMIEMDVAMKENLVEAEIGSAAEVAAGAGIGGTRGKKMGGGSKGEVHWHCLSVYIGAMKQMVSAVYSEMHSNSRFYILYV